MFNKTKKENEVGDGSYVIKFLNLSKCNILSRGRQIFIK